MKLFPLGVAAFAAMIALAHAQEMTPPPAENGAFAVEFNVRVITGETITMVWNVRSFPDAKSCTEWLDRQMNDDEAPDSKDPIFARDLAVLELLAERNHAMIEPPTCGSSERDGDGSI